MHSFQTSKVCRIMQNLKFSKIDLNFYSWLEEFSHASGFQALQEIITDYKTKYSILFNNNTGNQYYNSNFLTGTLLSNQSGYNSNEFKDKDTQLSKEIRFECIKTIKSFINTSVNFSIKKIFY